MNKTLRLLLINLLLVLPHAAQAMTLERVNDDLYATGPTVDPDFLSFKQAFAKGGIKRLILVNAPGGDLWTGMQVARMVQDAKIKTVVSGSCMSACSLIFMAGQERAFGTGHLPRVTLVGIHGAHAKDTKQVNPQAMPQMYALYKQQLGEKFDSEVINQALYDIKEANGFLRIREIERNLEKDRTPWFCPTGQTPLEQCRQHQGKDALSLGVVTQSHTEVLELPASMQLKIEFFGRQLTSLASDLPELASQWTQTLCAENLACNTQLGTGWQNYLNAQTHKAIALGWGKPGFGYKVSDDTPGMAMLRALYACNHAPKNAKLCRLMAVNDHPLGQFYDDSQNPPGVLLQNLKFSTPDMAEQERNEPGAGSPSKMRGLQQLTGMTPRNLEGIQRWNTPELVEALRQSERPVLIDVGASGPMIPGALNFIHGGLAFEDEKKEIPYTERFRNMMLAAAPDMQQPVVFYCASSECWLSVNAAMRARQLGYNWVIWYRGGMNAWTRSGLPTAGRVPVAVLN